MYIISRAFIALLGGAVMNGKAGKSTWYLCTIFVSGTCRLLHSHSMLLDRYGNFRAISKYWGRIKLTYGREITINLKIKFLYFLILLWSDKCNLFFFSQLLLETENTWGAHIPYMYMNFQSQDIQLCVVCFKQCTGNIHLRLVSVC